jgi:hypothetical protein
VILIDRENTIAPRWSHVVSDTNDVAELEAFRKRVGAPPSALQRHPGKRPHLDLRGRPRDRAIAITDDPNVRVFETTMAMVRELRRIERERAAKVFPHRQTHAPAPSAHPSTVTGVE